MTYKPEPLIEHLKSIRKANRMAVRDLAPLLGYHENTIYYIERNERKPTLQFIIDYAQYFGLELNLCASSKPTKSQT